MDPSYISVDDDGNLGSIAEQKIPKWRNPDLTTDRGRWEARVLHAVGLKYWPKEAGSKDLRMQMLVVFKSMSGMSGSVIPKYPTEFIDEVITWFSKRSQRFVGYQALKGMLHKFNDDEWRQRFIATWMRNHPDAEKKDYDRELPPEKEWKFE